MNHGNVSFSEFLQSPIPERVYDIGGVSPELADEDIVNISGSRVPDSSNTGTQELRKSHPADGEKLGRQFPRQEWNIENTS